MKNLIVLLCSLIIIFFRDTFAQMYDPNSTLGVGHVTEPTEIDLMKARQSAFEHGQSSAEAMSRGDTWASIREQEQAEKARRDERDMRLKMEQNRRDDGIQRMEQQLRRQQEDEDGDNFDNARMESMCTHKRHMLVGNTETKHEDSDGGIYLLVSVAGKKNLLLQDEDGRIVAESPFPIEYCPTADQFSAFKWEYESSLSGTVRIQFPRYDQYCQDIEYNEGKKFRRAYVDFMLSYSESCGRHMPKLKMDREGARLVEKAKAVFKKKGPTPPAQLPSPKNYRNEIRYKEAYVAFMMRNEQRPEVGTSSWQLYKAYKAMEGSYIREAKSIWRKWSEKQRAINAKIQKLDRLIGKTTNGEELEKIMKQLEELRKELEDCGANVD